MSNGTGIFSGTALSSVTQLAAAAACLVEKYEKYINMDLKKFTGPKGDPGPQGPQGPAGSSTAILNTLDSDRPDAALSAAMGKVLGGRLDIISTLVNASTSEKLRLFDLDCSAVGDNNTITIEYPFSVYQRVLFLYLLTSGDASAIPPMFGVLQTSVGELNPDLPIDKQWAYINNNAILTGWDQVNFSLKLKDAEAGVTVDNVTQNLKLQKSFGTHGSSMWYAHGFILVYNTMDGKAMTLTFSKE